MASLVVRTPSIPTIEVNAFKQGDQGETLVQLKLREKLDRDSRVLWQLPPTTLFTVLEVGDSSRLKISAANGVVGWISYQTQLDQPLVKRVKKQRVSFSRMTSDSEKSTGTLSTSPSTSSLPAPTAEEAVQLMKKLVPQKAGDPSVGEECEALVPLNMREEQDYVSCIVAVLQQGTKFTITEVGWSSRMRVTTPSGISGWVTARAELGQPLIKKVHRKKRLSFKQSSRDGEVRDDASTVTEDTITRVSSFNDTICTTVSNSSIGLDRKPATAPSADSSTPQKKTTPPMRWLPRLICCRD